VRVTEAEWQAATDPVAVLQFLRQRAQVNARQLRLVGCACARLIWKSLGEEPPSAIEAAEGFAEGAVTKAALRRARQEVRERRYLLPATGGWPQLPFVALWLAEVVASENASGGVVAEMKRNAPPIAAKELGAACELIRDVAGSRPFRATPTVAAGWRAWNEGGVPQLAHATYENRRLPDGTLDPARLVLLADALEDAGCTDAELLGHLRGTGPHVRGCWAVDLVLGKS
jgi:hypothetical protein